MTIDEEDNLYVATWEGGAVYKIDPRQGKVVAIIRVPGARRVTSCAFGGDDLQDLFITSAATGTNRENEPNAGNLFQARIENARGVPAFKYAG